MYCTPYCTKHVLVLYNVLYTLLYSSCTRTLQCTVHLTVQYMYSYSTVQCITAYCTVFALHQSLENRKVSRKFALPANDCNGCVKFRKLFLKTKKERTFCKYF